MPYFCTHWQKYYSKEKRKEEKKKKVLGHFTTGNQPGQMQMALRSSRFPTHDPAHIRESEPGELMNTIQPGTSLALDEPSLSYLIQLEPVLTAGCRSGKLTIVKMRVNMFSIKATAV